MLSSGLSGGKKINDDNPQCWKHFIPRTDLIISIIDGDTQC